MSGWSWRRRRFIVPGFQGRFIATQLAWWTLFLFAAAAALFVPSALGLRASDPQRRLEAADTFLLLHHYSWPALLVLFAVAAVVTVHMSHRIAGPLYRLRRVCEQVTAGDLTVSMRVRRGDYLVEEAAAFEAMLVSLRTRFGTAQGQGAVASPASGAASVELEPEIDRAGARAREQTGFSVIEILVVAGIIGVLAAISTPRYMAALESARIARAVGDIKAIEKEVVVHFILDGCYPGALADIGRDALLDPWGHGYTYNVVTRKRGGCQACHSACVSVGQARKDRALVPINSDFDLFSMGKDGKSAASLAAAQSRDDIVRGSDGAFVGLGANY